MSEEDTHVYMEDRTAGAYLTQARRAFFNCGEPGQLYGTWREPADMGVTDRMLRHLRALDKQLDWARTSTLFSALAGEAYINGFLSETLRTNADYEAVERLPTLDKYVLGTELAVGERLFERGNGPGQTLGTLFKLRHDLVHPKMKRVRMDKGTLMDERFTDFNAEAAAAFVVTVAEAARTLLARLERDEDKIIESVLSERDRFLALGAVLRTELPKPRGESQATWRPLLGNAAAESAATRDEEAQERPRQAAALPPVRRLRRDRLKPPPTVPLKPDDMLDYLRSMPGTATGVYRYGTKE